MAAWYTLWSESALNIRCRGAKASGAACPCALVVKSAARSATRSAAGAAIAERLSGARKGACCLERRARNGVRDLAKKL